MKPYKRYDEYLSKALTDPQEAAAYLNAALEEDDSRVFLMAYYDVARAHGVKVIADKAKLHRVSLNKMLSKNGNPGLKNILRVLAASNLRIRIEPAIRSDA